MKSTGDKKTDTIMRVVQSLEDLRQHCLGIDIDSIDLCSRMLREYADRAGSPLIKKDAAPVSYPPEIDAVIMLLNKVSNDLEFIRDVIIDSTGQLDQSLAE